MPHYESKNREEDKQNIGGRKKRELRSNLSEEYCKKNEEKQNRKG
jgi:hypothetical protein